MQMHACGERSEVLTRKRKYILEWKTVGFWFVYSFESNYVEICMDFWQFVLRTGRRSAFIFCNSPFALRLSLFVWLCSRLITTNSSLPFIVHTFALHLEKWIGMNFEDWIGILFVLIGCSIFLYPNTLLSVHSQ